MSELQFPKDPIVGQQYDFPPYKYYWDGVKWKTIGIGYNPVNDLRNELEPKVNNNVVGVFEALRRSYAEAGLNLVDGSFEEGGTLTSASDVLLHKASGIAYSGPIGSVTVGTDPTAVGSGYVSRADVLLRSELAGASGTQIISYFEPALGRSVTLYDAISSIEVPCKTLADIQAANDYFVSSGKRGRCKLIPGLSLSLTSQLQINISYTSVDFNGAIITSSIVSGASIAVTATATNGTVAYTQNLQVLRGFELVGPGSGISAAKGIEYSSAIAGTTAGRVTVENASIHGFGVGELYGSRAYLVSHNNVSLWGNGTSVSEPAGSSDYGENVSYFGGSIFNSSIAIDVKHPSSSFCFVGTSIDYNGQTLICDGATVSFHGGHIEENSSSRSFVVTGNGANVVLEPTWMQKTGGTPDYYMQIDSGCVVRVKSRISNIPTSSGHMYTGEGLLDIQGQSYNQHGLPRILGAAAVAQRVKDPTFASGLPSNFFLTVGGTLTDQWTGTIYALTNPGGNITGTKLLGGAATFGIMAQFPECAMAAYKMTVVNNGAGSVFATPYWASIGYDSAGIPVLREALAFDSAVTIATGTTTLQSSGTQKNRRPAWATHLVILFNCNGQTTGTTITVDDCYITKIS